MHPQIFPNFNFKHVLNWLLKMFFDNQIIQLWGGDVKCSTFKWWIIPNEKCCKKEDGGGGVDEGREMISSLFMNDIINHTKILQFQ